MTSRLSADDREDLIWYYSSAPGALGLRSHQAMCEEILSAGVLPGKHERKYQDGMQDRMLASAARARRVAAILAELRGRHEQALRLQYTRTDLGWAETAERGHYVCIDGYTIALILGTELATRAFAKAAKAAKGTTKSRTIWVMAMHRANTPTAKAFIAGLIERASEWLRLAEEAYTEAARKRRQ
jgi:hypothetical protein